MRSYYLLFLLLAFGLIFIFTSTPAPRKQAQEVGPILREIARNTYRIHFEISSEKEKPIADILWFHEAAKVALRKKIPWFNVLEEKITPYYVEGIIQLEKDPMKAEYDAYEILNLQLDKEHTSY
jgi:hypothetical protein